LISVIMTRAICSRHSSRKPAESRRALRNRLRDRAERYAARMVNAPTGSGVDFFQWVKQASEAEWRPGLEPAQIAAFEAAVGYAFPASYRTMLSVMNGTLAGASHRSRFYSFPDDLAEMREAVTWACEGYDVRPDELAARGIAPIQPLFGHRYLLIDGSDDPMVLSIYGRDTIVYSLTLRSYLLHELFGANEDEACELPPGVFWLDTAEYPPPAPPELLAVIDEHLRKRN
jgi:hypothetical protein